MGWFGKLLLIGVAGYAGYYYSYNLHRGGYFSLPDIPDGAYPISFKSGFRAVVYDMEVSDNQYAATSKYFRRLTLASRDRRFIGIPSDVPRWFEDTWSACRPGSEEEREYIISTMPEDVRNEMVGARLDALCFIEVEGDRPLLRGLIYSVPA